MPNAQKSPSRSDGKFVIEGRIYNAATGVDIPEDEPIFVFRGKDALAIEALLFYLRRCVEMSADSSQVHGVVERCLEFSRWANENEVQMPSRIGE